MSYLGGEGDQSSLRLVHCSNICNIIYDMISYDQILILLKFIYSQWSRLQQKIEYCKID